MEELYYPRSENKGADQLRSCCEADVRLCFRLGKNPVFSRRGKHIFVCKNWLEKGRPTYIVPTYAHLTVDTKFENMV